MMNHLASPARLCYDMKRMTAGGNHMAEKQIPEPDFYGSGKALCTPVSDEYPGIRNPGDLYTVLRGIWCPETCAPRMRKDWTVSNPALGQCSVTAFLAQDIFGGTVRGILLPDGNYHCYNDVSGCVFDLTSSQFGAEAANLSYQDNPEQLRSVHFAQQEKEERYQLLKKLLQDKLRPYAAAGSDKSLFPSGGGTVLTIGETMAAFTPAETGSLRYVRDFRIKTAGAESNTAIGLAKLGISAEWFSRLGDDEFGAFLVRELQADGVSCRHVIRDAAHRTGIMFKELSPSGTKVYYYRENSAASHLSPDDIRPELLEGIRLLHLTGITPVLSESCRETVSRVYDLAAERGIPVSFDPNIRKRLWQDSDYSPLLRELISRSAIVLAGLDEARALYGTETPEAALEAILNSGPAVAAIKDSSHGAWISAASMENRPIFIPPYPCNPVEPVGAGDGFNAGFLAGLLQGKDPETAGRIGAVCGALATQVSGDTEGYPDAAQLNEILAGSDPVLR